MKDIGDIKDIVVDDKATPTSRLINNISLSCSALACLIFIVYIIIFLSCGDSQALDVLKAINVLFFVEIALIVVACVLAIVELFRNIFLSAIFSLALSVLVAVCITIFLVYAYQLYHFVLLAI